jgi:hypothetical protein
MRMLAAWDSTKLFNRCDAACVVFWFVCMCTLQYNAITQASLLLIRYYLCLRATGRWSRWCNSNMWRCHTSRWLRYAVQCWCKSYIWTWHQGNDLLQLLEEHTLLCVCVLVQSVCLLLISRSALLLLQAIATMPVMYVSVSELPVLLWSTRCGAGASSTCSSAVC